MKFILKRISELPYWDALCPESKLLIKPIPREKIVISTNRSDGIFQCGEPVRFSISYCLDDKPVAGKKMLCKLERDFLPAEEFPIISQSLPVEYTTTLRQPGFVRLSVSCGEVSAAYGAGFEPEKITAAPEIAGFDAFWQERKKELNAIPAGILNFKKIPLDDPAYEGRVECYDVQIACTDNTPVSGVLAVPVNAKPESLPAYVFFHGAGVRSAFQPLTWAAHGMIAFNVNAHGIENYQTEEYYQAQKKRLDNYPCRIAPRPEDSLFVHMTLRVLRALEFIKSRPEYDGHTLIVHGGSQGGYQALAAAGLDPDVKLIIANAPAMCNLGGSLEGRTPVWPFTTPELVATLKKNQGSFFCDGASFARRAQAQAVFTVGFSDCAAVPSSIYAAYNVYAGEKQLMPFPELGHEKDVFWTAESEIVRFITPATD